MCFEVVPGVCSGGTCIPDIAVLEVKAGFKYQCVGDAEELFGGIWLAAIAGVVLVVFYLLDEAIESVGSHQVRFPMCTLETQQKYCSTGSLLLTFCYFTLSILKVSFPQTMTFSCIFVFAPSLIRMDLSIVTSSTSLTFSRFLVLFASISSLFLCIEVILHFHLPGGTSDIIMSVLHVSSMFSTSSSFLELHQTSFHQASSSFIKLP